MTAHANKATSNPAPADSSDVLEDDDAYDEVDAEERQLRYRRYRFWGVVVTGVIFIGVTVVTGTFVGTNALLSWVWIIPLLLAVVCLVAKRLHFLLVPLVLLLGLMVVVFIGYSDEVWALLAGNETRGLPGLWNLLDTIFGAIPIVGGFIGWLIQVLGWFINMFLAFGLPVLLMYALAKRILDHESSLGGTLVLALLTAASFIAPVGWAVLMNAGY